MSGTQPADKGEIDRKTRQLQADIEKYNKEFIPIVTDTISSYLYYSVVSFISTEIGRIKDIDSKFQELVQPLNNPALQAEASRRRDLQLWELDPLPTDKVFPF